MTTDKPIIDTDFSSISAKEVFQTVQPFIKKKKVLPYLIFGTDLLLFISLFFAILISDNLLIKLIGGLMEGFIIGFLFTIGHDCCHNSFTSNKKINTWIGKIAFLPSLHNYSLWDVLHNQVHHSFTNLRSKDYVYTPLSPNEYLAYTSFQKFKYKIYRSSFGHLPYYLYEIWWKKMLFPNDKIPFIKNSKEHWLNVIPLIFYVIGIFSITISLSIQGNQNVFLNTLAAIVIPFLVWNWMMGFVIYQHHTNLYTKWFSREEEWEYWEVQIGHSTHIEFPKPINQLFHNIMEHTAHHSNMDIPMYNLGKAQNEIEKKFKDKVKVIQWSWKFYFESINACKLYDYETHQWLTFKQAEIFKKSKD